MSQEMATFVEAEDLLAFCLEHRTQLSGRDWLASLTLLTTRRRVSTASLQFRLYGEALLESADAPWGSRSIHLLLHRFGVLGYGPAVWRLLPVLQVRISELNPKELTLSAWALGRCFVGDLDSWDVIGDAFRQQAASFSVPDLAMMAWAMAAVERAVPKEVLTLKRLARGLLAEVGESANSSAPKKLGAADRRVRGRDVAMLLRAISRITPSDTSFLGWLALIAAQSLVNRAISFEAQGICTLWAALATMNLPRLHGEVVEALCESSRQLRLDHTFNQDMAAELARALLTLKVHDPRPTHQVIDFVARKGLALRADTLLVLTEFMAIRGGSDLAWKRLGVRAQQRAVDLSLPDLDRLIGAFRRSGQGNRRIYGMFQLFVRIREDNARYGAA